MHYQGACQEKRHFGFTSNPQQMGCTILIILLSSLRAMVFLMIKFFMEITYQWNTVTQPFIASKPFSSFVVPAPGMAVRKKEGERGYWQ